MFHGRSGPVVAASMLNFGYSLGRLAAQAQRKSPKPRKPVEYSVTRQLEMRRRKRKLQRQARRITRLYRK